MDAANVVIADDGTLCAPGDGRIGMLANSGHIPLGYYKDEKKTAATFPVIDGVRYAVPGDMASVDADGSIAVYGRGLGLDQLRRREDLPRGGGEGAEEPPGRVRRDGGRHAQRALRLAGDRGRRAPAASTPTIRPRSPSCRSTAGSTSPATRCRARSCSSTTRVRSPSGKPDYRWAKETALAGLPPAT